MTQDKDANNGKKIDSIKKKARKSLPKVKELKNTQSDVVGGAAAAKMVSVAPCSGVFTGCGC